MNWHNARKWVKGCELPLWWSLWISVHHVGFLVDDLDQAISTRFPAEYYLLQQVIRLSTNFSIPLLNRKALYETLPSGSRKEAKIACAALPVLLLLLCGLFLSSHLKLGGKFLSLTSYLKKKIIEAELSRVVCLFGVDLHKLLGGSDVLYHSSFKNILDRWQWNEIFPIGISWGIYLAVRIIL